jgi:hypothetical protein
MVAAMTTSGGRRMELTWEDLTTTRFWMSVKKRNSQAATLPTGDPMIQMNTISGAFAGAAALGSVDSRDSLFRRSVIQDCLWGGGFGCDVSFGVE